MAEKRSLFQKIFGVFRDRRPLTQLRMLSGYNPIFTPWSNKPYEADVVRSAVDAIARNAAKLKAKHIRRVDGQIIPVGGQIERLLQVRPNQNMNAYDFLYKLVTTLMIDNNAFAYIKFHFFDGESLVLPYSEVIHLRRHYYANDLLGENNVPINATLSAIHTTNEGLAQAVKTSANLRGIIKYQGMLKESDIKANRDRFVAEYMTMQNTGGIAALDAKAEYIPLNNEPKMVNAAQMKELRDAVYRYFGVNENIIMGKYSEEEWAAFYEGTIEPLAVQMSLEFTSKLFTERERGFGNEIIFEANRLQYASVNTKVAMVEKMMPMGLLTINEAREIFNLAPVEDGDKRLVSLNYVQADKQNLYQIGEDEQSEGDEDNVATQA